MRYLKPIKVNKNNMFKKHYLESGDMLWSKEDGVKRQKILKEVGLEYKQINLLASVLAEIVKTIPELQDNEIIKKSMVKFDKINKIRAGLE